jgi:hypothetical protein
VSFFFGIAVGISDEDIEILIPWEQKFSTDDSIEEFSTHEMTTLLKLSGNSSVSYRTEFLLFMHPPGIITDCGLLLSIFSS